jgi:hypothetical protein
MGKSARLISLARTPFPRVGDHTYALRALLDVSVSGSTLRMLADVVMFSAGRGEGTLTIAAPYAARSAMKPTELALARRMAERMPRG